MERITCPLSLAAQKYGNRPAIISGDAVFSYRHLDKSVAATALSFQKKFKKGDRIAICDQNSIEYVIILLALWRAAMTACPVSTRLPQKALKASLKRINAKTLIANSRGFIAKNGINTVKEHSLRLSRNATIIFTSGSSGEPKAALHSYGSHYYNAKGANENIPLKSSVRWLLTLPLYHVGGIGILFRTLLAGATLVIPQKKLSMAETIRRFKITHVSLVPTQLYRILKEDPSTKKLSGLKAILLGGAFVPETLFAEAKDRRVPLYKTYGLTEMASQVATAPRPWSQKVQALNYRTIKVSAQNEILVKGKTLFKGYVERERTVLPLDRDGWFATGDLGTLDAKGNLTVTGRKDNMFISGGENIQPEEIERLLCQAGKIETAVVVPVEDPEYGFRPVAFIKKRDSAPLQSRELAAYLKQYLPRFKIPEQFYRWPKRLPENRFKADRQYLTELAKIKGG